MHGGISPVFIQKSWRSLNLKLWICWCDPSLKSASIMEDKRVDKIKPLFKNDSRGEPRKYRTMNLISLPGKLGQNYNGLSHLSSVNLNRIYRGRVSMAFIKGVHTSLIYSSSSRASTSNEDQWDPVDRAYLDFQKAFDKVPQQSI